jgi:hypothetical protein
MSPGLLVEVRLVRAEPTPAQLRAWAALWQRLLAPAPDLKPLPADEAPRPHGGGGDDV